jgi:hypothetical protein
LNCCLSALTSRFGLSKLNPLSVIAVDREDPGAFYSTIEEVRPGLLWESDTNDSKSGPSTFRDNTLSSVGSSDTHIYWKDHVSLQDLENFNAGPQQANLDTTLFGYAISGPSKSSHYALKQEQVLESLCFSRKELRDKIIKDDSASLRKERQSASASKAWLQLRGATSYPSKKQLEELAFAEGKTTKQVRIALNNLRARTKQGESAVYRKTGKLHANTRQTRAGTLLI